MTTLISSQSASGSTVTFSSIPGGYSSLTLVADSVSHNNGTNAQPKIAVSADGTTFSTPLVAGALAAASANYNGVIGLPGYSGDRGYSLGGFAPIMSPGAGASSSFVWTCAGGITAIRLSLSAGSFDAGTFSLYGE